MTSLPDQHARSPYVARIVIGTLLAVYVATGLYTVPANEIAVVRRFGQAVWPPRTSGLHFDLPWPLTRIDRVNLNAVRTLAVGEATDEASAILAPTTNQPTTFLTGDRNLLQLRVVVQYRVSEEFLAEWLYACDAPEQRLRSQVESTVADLVSRSGVDFVHTQGLAELNNRLLLAVRAAARDQRLGCDVEQVTIDRAEPPARVKADFLDVSNARADMSRSINEARAYAEQRLAESQADARQLIDLSERERGIKVSRAKGAADRFVKLADQVLLDARTGGRDYVLSRHLTLNRMYVETLREVLGRAKSKVVLDGPQPTDVMLPSEQSERQGPEIQGQ
jgi:membrane protease subunit HflK